MKAFRWIVVSFGVIALGGCCTRAVSDRAVFDESVRAEIYDRAERPFARALLVKPFRTDENDPVEVKLAPLIFLETATVTNWSKSSATNQAASPVIRVLESKALLGTNTYSQLSYVWESLPGNAAQQHLQGVRLTLSDEGDPVAWEILNDPSDAQVVFVAQSVEADAMKRLGAPVVERRFSVERLIAEAPSTVISSVVENGPAAMGPMVFVNTNGAVSALTCRCMPVQTDQLSGEVVYRISKADARSTVMSASPSEMSSDWFDPRRLEKALRVRELVGD